MAKEYIRPVPATWWLKKRSYRLFIVRELTCLFVGGYAVFLLVLVSRAQNASDFAQFFEALKSPLSVVLHLIALAMVIFHAVTWLYVTPKLIVVWRGEQRVPGVLIAGAHYVMWFAVSAIVAWIALG